MKRTFFKRFAISLASFSFAAVVSELIFTRKADLSVTYVIGYAGLLLTASFIAAFIQKPKVISE